MKKKVKRDKAIMKNMGKMVDNRTEVLRANFDITGSISVAQAYLLLLFTVEELVLDGAPVEDVIAALDFMTNDLTLAEGLVRKGIAKG